MNKKVLVYSTPTCPYCIKVKQFLKENNVEFENIDVSANPQAGQEIMDKSGQIGVPVLDIAGEIIIGFDRDKILKALEL